MRKNNIDSFYLNKNERTGIYFLIILFIASTLLPWFYQKKYVKQPVQLESFNPDGLMPETNYSCDPSRGKSMTSINLAHEENAKYSGNAKTLFAFDPNKLSEKEAINLGIPSKTFENLQKYLNKGGKIKSKEQFEKIYGLTPELYQKLKDYIQFEQRKPKELISKKSGFQIKTVDLNIADEEEFIQLPLIAEKLAARIVKYRKLLGGFISIDQLNEVYGITDTTLEVIRPYLSITKNYNRIDLKNFGLNELGIHPYIGYKKAKLIRSYIYQHPEFKGSTDLQLIKGLDTGFIRKIKPYLIDEN